MRYYYKDEKGNYYSYKEIHEDLIEISEEEWNDHIKVTEITKEEKIKTVIRMQINELKQLLSSTDYQAIKYAEGELTEEEYEPIKIQRRLWRSQINDLESQL